MFETNPLPLRPPSILDKVTWQDILKLLGMAVIGAFAWANLQARIDSLTDRVSRNEAALSQAMPRELQQAHDALVLQRLDDITRQINQLSQKMELGK